MSCKHWKEAATLIIISRNNLKPNTVQGGKLLKPNYKVPLLKRSAKNSFMPELYVFPGGSLDEADSSCKWFELFKKHGYSKDDLISKFRLKSGRPNLFSNKSDNELLPELAFKICAIRETFEETGLLLSTNQQNIKNKLLQNQEHEIELWRSRVYKDANEFIALFEHISELPDIWNLHDWRIWITPTYYSKRFATVFYVTFLDLKMSNLSHSEESDKLELCDPYDLLQSHYSGKKELAPPQIFELNCLLSYPDFNELKSYTEKKGKRLLPIYLPIKVGAKDGFLTILPGDSLYPNEPNYSGVGEESTIIPHTIEEITKIYPKMNRFEFKPPSPIKYRVNINTEFDPNDHLSRL